MGKLKAGIVGLSRGHGLVNALASHPDVEIAALCDVRSNILNELGDQHHVADKMRFTDYDEMVAADLDIITIATPIEYHAQQAIQAMEADKHVLSEQTAAYTVADCERLVETVKRTGKAYMMAENYTYFDYIQKWKKLIDAGKLGKIHYAEGEYLHEITDLLVDPKTGERQWRYTRAPIWYCAHCLGPLLMLMDDRIVRATGVHTGLNKYPGETIAYLDMEVGLFQTQKGAVIKILRSQSVVRHPDMVWYTLYGTKGFVENGRGAGWGETTGYLYLEDEMPKHPGAQVMAWNTVDVTAPPEARTGGHGTSEYYMVRDFISAIQNGTKPPIDVVRAVDFTIPGLIAHESAMQGGVWLDVPLLG
jgi:predicted dehydrogenase